MRQPPFTKRMSAAGGRDGVRLALCHRGMRADLSLWHVRLFLFRGCMIRVHLLDLDAGVLDDSGLFELR